MAATPDARPGQAVHLRSYESSDAAATAEVFRAAIVTTAARFYTEEQVRAWAGPVDLDAWDARRHSAWTLVAVSADRVVGFADLRSDAELDMLFVHPDAGGRGVARALVGAVLEEARARGYARVTTRASRAARAPFERFGFVVDAENPDNSVRGVAVPNFDMHLDL